MQRAESEQVDLVKSRLQLRLGELESERSSLRTQVDELGKRLEKAEREARGDTEEDAEGLVRSHPLWTTLLLSPLLLVLYYYSSRFLVATCDVSCLSAGNRNESYL